MYHNSEIILKVEGLTKNYPGHTTPALQGLDLEIRRGEILGLLGPNGAGKTTAVSIMSTLLVPSSGSVKICNCDISNRSKVRKIRRQIGLVPQDIALYQQLSARENLEFWGSLYGLQGKEKKERIDFCLDFVGLTKKSDERTAFFSGGMKRRLNIAAALMHQPLLLYLDEPTVGIDTQSRSMILDRLSRLRSQGTAMVYTTHYMEEVEELCDRVMILDQGIVVADGVPADLVRIHQCGNLQELYLSLTGRQLRD